MALERSDDYVMSSADKASARRLGRPQFFPIITIMDRIVLTCASYLLFTGSNKQSRLCPKCASSHVFQLMYPLRPVILKIVNDASPCEKKTDLDIWGTSWSVIPSVTGHRNMLMMFCEKPLCPPVLRREIEITEVEPQASHQEIPDIDFNHSRGLLPQCTQSHTSCRGTLIVLLLWSMSFTIVIVTSLQGTW